MFLLSTIFDSMMKNKEVIKENKHESFNRTKKFNPQKFTSHSTVCHQKTATIQYIFKAEYNSLKHF